MANDMAVDVGKIVYGQWLNESGCIEADLTVTRLSETSFVVVTAATSAVRDLSWIKRNIPDEAHCIVTDITSAEAVFSLMGPKSRSLLEAITPEELSNEKFPFGTAKEIEIGMGLARAHRISYVGELGWELYIPTDMAKHVFDTIIQNGSDKGLQLCGMHVLDSCRLEKAYRHFGHDITDEDHVLEAGLGFCVKLNKPMDKFGHFIGRDAVLAKKDRGLERRLLQFKLRDSMPLLYHNETIYRDGTLVGRITSGGFGHYLGASVGLGYVPCQRGETVEQLMNSDYEIDIAGTRVKAEVSIRPFYDPLNERVKL